MLYPLKLPGDLRAAFLRHSFRGENKTCNRNLEPESHELSQTLNNDTHRTNKNFDPSAPRWSHFLGQSAALFVQLATTRHLEYEVLGLLQNRDDVNQENYEEKKEEKYRIN